MNLASLTAREFFVTLLIFGGLGMVLYGQFAVTKTGAYLYVDEDPTPEADLSEDARIVAFENLSEPMQEKFEQRLSGERTYVGTESEASDELPWDLYQIGYVRYEGAYYETGMSVAHPPVAQSEVQLLGGVLLVIGAIAAGWRLHSYRMK